MLCDAPEEPVVIRKRSRLRQLPDHARQRQRQQTKKASIRTRPRRSRATEMPVQKPQRNERMNIDDPKTEEIGTEPVQRTQRQTQRNQPGPIGARLLFAAQPDQGAEPNE